MMISKTALLELAGETYFQRGLDYYNRGLVLSVEPEGDTVHAWVQGERRYHVELSLSPEFDGFCTCPVSARGEFCKHCVAAGLAALEQPEGFTTAGSEEAPSLRDWLEQWDKPALVDTLLDIIRHDARLSERWALKLQAQFSDSSPDAIRELVEQAFPEHQAWDHEEVEAYFENAELGMEEAELLIRQSAPEAAFQLAEFALKRLNHCFEWVDDSYGFSLSLHGQLKTLLAELFWPLPWSAGQKAQWLVEQRQQDNMIFPDILGDFTYAARQAERPIAEQERVTEAYYVECERQAATLPKLPLHADYETVRSHERLISPLIERAQQRGDLADEIAWHRKLATGFRDFLKLSELEMKRDDESEAEHWLDFARQVARDGREQEACVAQQISIYQQIGQPELALKQQWKRLERWPTLKNYQQVSEMAEQQGDEANVCRERAKALFATDAQRYEDQDRLRARDVPLLEFYFLYREYDKAQQWAAGRQLSEQQALTLARGLLSSQLDAAVGYYRQLVLHAIEQTNNPGYRQAVDLLVELRQGVAELGSDAGQSALQALIGEIRQREKRKRNLMKFMDVNAL